VSPFPAVSDIAYKEVLAFANDNQNDGKSLLIMMMMVVAMTMLMIQRVGVTLTRGERHRL
jgi:hypothetical protein